MTPFKAVCYVIGISQIVLGLLYLLAPAGFIDWQGLSALPRDLNYPIGMFAARLLVYGVGMFVIAQNPARYRFWTFGMVAIQVIDLGVGLFYVWTGVVAIEHAMIPMVNATLFIVLLLATDMLGRKSVAHA